jgi:hypothetical protein
MSITGGYLREISEPHVRRWPSTKGTDLRRVFVRISLYEGAGGHHYYPDVWEEDNPIWNAIENKWQVAHDDEIAKGRSF